VDSCWNKHGEEGLNEAEMSVSYLEREVPTDVEEEHEDVNEAYILGLSDDDIVYQVVIKFHNIAHNLYNNCVLITFLV
jgi:hypothetical protein